IVHVDLPETREALSDLLVRKDADAEGRLAFDILVERDLGAGQQANRDVRIADRREPAGDRVDELGRYELVADLGGTRGDMVQTIVAHGGDSFAVRQVGIRALLSEAAGAMIVCRTLSRLLSNVAMSSPQGRRDISGRSPDKIEADEIDVSPLRGSPR